MNIIQSKNEESGALIVLLKNEYSLESILEWKNQSLFFDIEEDSISNPSLKNYEIVNLKEEGIFTLLFFRFDELTKNRKNKTNFLQDKNYALHLSMSAYTYKCDENNTPKTFFKNTHQHIYKTNDEMFFDEFPERELLTIVEFNNRLIHIYK